MSGRVRRSMLSSAVVLVAAGCGAAPAQPGSPALVPIGAGLQGRAGLTAAVYARGLTTASAFAFDAQGRLWVTTAAYTDQSHDGLYVVAGAQAAPVEVVSGLHTPLGLLWYGGSLYVASHARVDAYSGFNGSTFATDRVVLTLPTGIGEDNNLVLAGDGRILMGISAPCDHCTPSSAMSAAIVSFRPDGSDLQLYASRIRAPFGLTFFPGTSDLFVTMNQRDDLGTGTPGDWLAVVEPGQSWGFPGCYGQATAGCQGEPGPVAVLDAHAAVGGVAIVQGELGAAVGTAALVAEWSDGRVQAVSLNRSATAYTGSVSPFLTGIQHPVPVLLGPDGALFVGDWGSGIVYRVAG